MASAVKLPKATRRNAASTTGQAAFTTTPEFPIVGIGASAGGLESLKSLLSALPDKPGMAFVVVAHLDPAPHSIMAELLGQASRLPVLTVKDGMLVEPNHVYVIPPNADMTIAERLLHLTPRQPGERAMPVDSFLRSLAEDQPGNAIGIILSGMGHDGSLGITAIKGEGGFTFAQDSQSAKFDAMPNSAVETGCVDFVLPPVAIAAELGRIRQHPYITHRLAETARGLGAEAEYGLPRLFEIMKRAGGIDFSGYKRGTIGRRILRRMALKQMEHFADYVRFVDQHPEEALALHQDFLIEVTRFFRNPEAFDALKRIAFPALLKDRAPNDTIRVWVPGCSSGEEVYSHAICLFEYLSETRAEFSIQVFGTDVNESAIRRARTGIFRENISADVSPARLRRFFNKVDQGYRMSKAVRDVCVFARQNVISDPPFSRMDIVSCRNLLIYLGPELQKRLVPVLHYALRPNGYLMLGATEGLVGTGAELFEPADAKNRIYRRQPVRSAATFGFALQNVESLAHVQAALVRPAIAPEPPESLLRQADDFLIAKYGPAAVVVNQELDVVEKRGAVASYLHVPRGKKQANLRQVMPTRLMPRLRAAIETARKAGRAVCGKQLRVRRAGRTRVVDIEVMALHTTAGQPMYLIGFREEAAAKRRKPGTRPSAPRPVQAGPGQEFRQLNDDLSASQQRLELLLEKSEAENAQLQVSNEEIQSANEELQSTNEELQISKEELESGNAELKSINEEMQHRNQQLSGMASDLTNILNSVNLPIMMLDPDLKVTRFTPQAEKVLGVRSADQGKPIGHNRLKIDSADLEEKCMQVMRDLAPREFSIRDDDGRAHVVRIAPCRTAENEITGVVLMLPSGTAPASS